MRNSMRDMKPYYENNNGVLYHGDCLEIMPQLGPVDLVLTDPPYGISLPTNYKERGRCCLAVCNNYKPVHDDNKPFNPSFLLELNKPTVLFGANYFADRLPASSGWIVWDKLRPVGIDQADAEIAWTNFVKGVRVFRHLWHGMMRASEHGKNYHPTQKPVVLMEWVLMLRWTPQGTVLDPFLGSGTTAVACERLGRKWIGIEISEEYCEIAAKRIDAENRQLKLF